jgi:hypothetical protein
MTLEFRHGQAARADPLGVGHVGGLGCVGGPGLVRRGTEAVESRFAETRDSDP